MSILMIYGIILIVFVFIAIVSSIIFIRMLNKEDTIELVQGKLENTDSFICDAMKYLKITNEWSE